MEFDFVLYDMMYVCILYVCMYLDELRVIAALLFRSSCRTATATVHPLHVIFMYVICLCLCMYVSVVTIEPALALADLLRS